MSVGDVEVEALVSRAVGCISRGLRPAEFRALIKCTVNVQNPLHARVIRARQYYEKVIVPQLQKLASGGGTLTPRTYVHYKRLRARFVCAYNKRLTQTLKTLKGD